eukprot:9182129-Ditylum_brightwellii.AAC.1
MAQTFSPISVFDVAEVPLMKLHRERAVIMVIATELLQSDLSWMKIQNIQVLQNKGSVSDALVCMPTTD